MKIRAFENLLKTKFQFAEVRKGRHTFYVLQLPDLPPVRTMVSHSKQEDIGPRLESDMARELRVSVLFFRGMFRCDNSRDEYCDLLRREQDDIEA